MPRTAFLVIDDFYKDPDAVRAAARKLTFRSKPGATYPGREAVVDEAGWDKVRKRIRRYIDDNCDCPCPKDPPFRQGKFRLALAVDEKTRLDGVHEDVQTWSAVIYLAQRRFCQGGIGLYRHRETGLTRGSPEWEQAVFGDMKRLSEATRKAKALAYMKDPRNWEQIGLIPMVYNRLVILNAHCFHASLGVFGDSLDNGRLTQHFEFYTVVDWLRVKGR
jgi:Family of unknown function (DUF6445)